MNKISDRRKIHGQPQINSQEEGNLIRMTTSGMVSNLPPSVQQLKKIIKQMEQTLKQERQKRIQLQQNIKLLQFRGIEKQKQFLKILRQKSKQVYKYSKPTEESDNLNDLRAVYNSIVSNFQLTSNLTNTLIQKKYRENQSAMQRRIGNILMVLQQQIKRCRQMSSQNLQAIKAEVQKALYIVKGIQTQNVDLMQKLQKEKSKTKLLEEQRKLLLQQLVNKKMLILKLYQATKKQKKESQLTLQQNERKIKSTHKYSSYLEQQQLKTAKMKLKTLQSCQHTETRNAFSTNNIRDISQKNSLQKQDYYCQDSIKLDQNQFTIKLQKQPKENTKKIQGNVHHRNYKKMLNPENSQGKSGVNNRKNYLNLEKKYGKNSRNKNSVLITSNQTQMSLKIKYRNDSQKKNLISCSIPLNDPNQKTIRHLKLCLQREKKKSYELGKIVAKMQSKQVQINESILNMLYQSKQKQLQNGQGIQNAAKFQGLLKLITDLQHRLSMCEPPAINCGFGQLEVEKLLQDN